MKKMLYITIVLVIAILMANIWYYKYKYTKEIKRQQNVLKQQLKDNDVYYNQLISNIKTKTDTIYISAKQIDAKLKQDAKTIDTTNVSDDDLDLFLSRYDY